MNIKELISQAGKHLRSEFELIKESNPHFAERGAEAEIILKDFLNSHLPKRFAADTGLVIDEDNNISSQTDVIIYDALNSPIYRKGERILILPNDNVASVIEVKSMLSKAELEDASKKIASVKKLKTTPITSADQPVTFSSLITTKTLGVVFAYDSTTSLVTLAENLREINQSLPSAHWIDIVVVLDKGVIGYTMQLPLSSKFPGWFAGACSKDFPVPPFYIHLVKEDLGDLTLNRFFVNLMAHLTFYRKRTTNLMEGVMGKHAFECMTLQGYQYNLKRDLVPCEEKHQEGNLLKSLVKFNLYSTKDGNYIGQIAWMPWQDGASISYSGRIGPPDLFYRPFFEFTKTKGIYIQGREDANVWLSSVIPLSKEDFIRISEKFEGDIVAKYYEGDEDGPPPFTLEEYEKRKTNKENK
jgi:hypothetical protein